MKTLRLFLITPHHNSLCFPPLDQKKKCSNYDISAEKQREENEIFLKKNFI
jgi:hypothetical protein